MIDGAEEYRAEPGSVRNAGVVRRTSFPSTVDEDCLSRRVHVKDRLQVAVCEPVEVDDDSDIFGRKRIDGTDPIFVRMDNIASISISNNIY